MRNIKIITSGTISLIVILTLGSCTFPPVTTSPSKGSHNTSSDSRNRQNLPSPTGSTSIKIATDLPVSGREQSYGKLIENGAHLAIDQANTNHTIPGYTLQFIPKDDVGPKGVDDPTVGAANVTALISDAEVAGIVGPFDSSVAKAEMPITNRAPLAQISPANTDPCLTKDTAASGCSGTNDLLSTLRPTGKVNYFRVVTTDDNQGLAGADYMAELGYKKVYVIDDAETYGMGNANAFIGEWQKLNLTVLGHASEPGTTTSYINLLTQIAATHPDFIYFGGLDSTGGVLLRQQMSLVPGVQNLTFLGGDGIMTPSFATTIQPSGGGPVYGTVAVVDTSQNPNAKSFRQQYAAAFPNDPINAYSAAAYDSANILIQAIKTALAHGAHTADSSSDASGAVAFRTAIISAIQNIQYDGVTGHQSFDANGDTNLQIISIYKLGLTEEQQPTWLYESSVQMT